MNAGKYCYILRITLLTAICWLAGSAFGFSQDYIFDADIIGVEDGLPHRNTYAITQDKEGFIWVSTLAGISRYDGYRFKNYDKAVLHIPESDTAWQLAVDATNRVWYSGNLDRFGTLFYSGLIDSRKDSIYTLEAVSKGRFTSKDVVYVGNSKATGDDVIIATRSGIIYNYNGDFEQVYRSPYPFSGDVLCEALPDGSYWLVHSNYTTCNHEVLWIKNGKIIERIKSEYGIERIVSPYPDLIIETPYFEYPPFHHWKLEKNTFVPYTIPGEVPENIQKLLQIHREYVFYATRHKLIVRDTLGNIIRTFNQLRATDTTEIPRIQNTFSDRQQLLWATTGNGLLKITSRKNPFKRIGPKVGVQGVYRDGEKLWTGNIFTNMLSGMQEQITPDGYMVTSFYKDDQGQLWIGTSGKLVIRYDYDTDTYTRYLFNNNLAFQLVFYNTFTQNYWLGTSRGMFRFDPETQKITPFPLSVATEEVYIRQFYQNKRGIWIVSDKGIFLMDAATETIVKHYTTADGLPVNNFNHLHEDAEGIFWLGARRGGLIRWDTHNNTFRQYTRENGLSNNTIYAVYEDDYGMLWLPSYHGLMAFDKNTESTRVYLPRHGITHEEFNTFGHFQNKDGTLYFGGMGGVISFHPKDLKDQTTVSPPLYVTQVRVLENNTEKLTDKTAAYTATKSIRLNSSDRILEVELILLDYERSTENRYAYKLTGQQEQWIYTTDNKFSIINPPYGRYDLVVKARGASGNWSKDPLVIPIHLPLPFYRQWWFLLSALFTLAAVVVIVVRWRIRKLKKDRQRLEAEVQKRTRKIAEQAEALKTLDKVKTRFFTNITHEFRTPLTLILGPAEQIITNDLPKAVVGKIRTIRHNAKQLLGLINQLLDISKLESGQMNVKTSTADIVAFSRELVQVFESLAGEKQQQLRFSSGPKAWETHFDMEKLSDIVYNLLSNALKYSSEKAIIEFLLSKTIVNHREHIKIQVKDTGMGISPETLPYIFDRFYQGDDSTTRKGEGTGIGLALVKELVELMNGDISAESKPGKGSVFTVLLPVLSPPKHPADAVEIAQARPPETGNTPAAIALEIPQNETSGEHKQELLIIEDNPQMRAYIRSCVDQAVYHITEAADGEEGIAKAQEIVPDLIISDVMMPKKDGFEVTHAIRSHIATSHIPLILLTARASEESRLEGLGRGADAYLTKPFSPKELGLRIKKLIELRKLLQQRYKDQNRELQADPVFQEEDSFINELKGYITEHIADPGLNVETIGRYFAVSRRQLYRKFNTLTNTTLNQYIQSVRMEKAMQLLREKKLNITEVTYATGFSSVSYFSKTFKKTYGKSPSEVL